MKQSLCHIIRSLTKRFRTRSSQRGFTMINLIASTLIGLGALAGTWLAYGNFTFQMRLMNANRQMDQYASSAFQHLCNYISWSWGGEPVGGSTNSAVWKFMIKDDFRGLDPLRYRTRNDFITVRCVPSGGILITDVMPSWARTGLRDQYIWRGRANQSNGDRLPAFDRRDGMTVTSFSFDYPATPGNVWELKYSLVRVSMEMQYRYNARYGISLYSNEYIHERKFVTTIFMRNWDVEQNGYRDTRRKLTQGS